MGYNGPASASGRRPCAPQSRANGFILWTRLPKLDSPGDLSYSPSHHMPASKEDIHRRLLIWLKAQDLEPLVGDNNICIRLQAEIGNWQCRIVVEDSHPPLGNPAAIHFISRMPIRIPKSRVADTTIMLHSLSRYMTFGTLSLDTQDRIVFYRITLPLDAQSTIEKTFEFALRQSIFYMEEHVGFLCFFCFNSEFNQKRADYHLNLSGLDPSKLTFPGDVDYHSDWVIGRNPPEEP